MSGIIFPDFLGTIAKVSAIDNSERQNAWLDEDRVAKKSVAPFIQGALSGDPTALNEIASRHPDTAMKIAPLLERLDAGKRAKVKEDADFITQTGVAILNAPPAQQPQLYAQVRAEAQAKGRDVSNWPTQYDPGWVKFNVDKAMPFAEHFKRSGEGVTFAPPAAGDGQPPGGGVNPNNIGNVRPVGGGPSAGFQQPATFDDGVRLAVNNAKAYPAAFNGGQPMTLMQIGAKWAPKGDGANDPSQWARNVASVSGLDPNRPLDLNDPQTAAAFARGVHGAEHGAGKVQPPEVYSRILAGGGPPGLPQGGDPPPRGDGSGNPIQPAQAQPQALQPLRGLQIPPGARVALQNGVPIVKDGNVLYLDANGGWGAAPLPKSAAPKEQGAGPFAGTGMEQQATNILIMGDPSSPEYAAAYAHMKAPRTTMDEQGRPVTIQPDVSHFRPPTPRGGVMPVAPGAAPVGSTQLPGGGTATVGQPVAPKGPSPKEMADLKAARTEAATIVSALADFQDTFKGSGWQDRAKSVAGMTTPLNTSYNVAALLAKGEQLFNLGVLNGPDLDIIRRTLPDPSTIRGAGTNSEDMSAATNKVIDLLQTRLAAKEKQLGLDATDVRKEAASIRSTMPGATDKPTSKPGTYLYNGKTPVSWDEIESTAKARKITTDEVIRTLGLQPTGMQ